MKHMLLLPAVICGLVSPALVAAHPHIFVDTGFTLGFDEDNQLVEIKVTWQYDEFYSLLITEDLFLDKDGDGQLTPDERQRLIGFDTNWDEGFNGDLEIRAGGQLLALSGPMQAGTDLIEGRIVSTHVRKIEPPVPMQDGPFSIKAFDPSYYTAYEIKLPVTLSDHLQGLCLLERIEPDIAGGLALMKAQLLRLNADADLEENDIPLMGGEFATEILVTCPAS
ncbi:DUF1007 family protein [Pseudophaeobacter sp.]|jgi:ABC-type uncharacterized transport system substrate-binding protein|uniref:DUF1007 family protein n=2 Tax=Pseudophaeobacter sp. TaxID=1971739 RepID=UPI0032D8B6B9